MMETAKVTAFPLGRLVACAVAIPLALIAAIGAYSYREEVEQARNESMRMAIAVGEQVVRLLEAEAMLLDLIDEEAGPTATCDELRADPRLHRFMQIGVRRAAQTANAWVIDETGTLCASSDPDKLDGRSRAFRDYFVAGRALSPGRFYVDRAVNGLITGVPIFNLARRRGEQPDFTGVIIGAVDLSVLQNYWRQALSIEDGQRVAVYRIDGAVVSRSWGEPVPDADPAIERGTARTWAREAHGTWRGSGPHGVDSVGAWRVIPEWGVVVTAGTETSVALADWERSLLVYGLMLTPLSVSLAAMYGLLWRARHRTVLDNARLEAEVERRTSNLRESEQRLREADRAKDEFLATLAHELRNPLAPIVTSLAVARQARTEPALHEKVISTASRQVSHLVRLVDDLLDVSRISRGHLELRPERATVQSLVRTAVEVCTPLIAASGHTLTVEMPEEPLHVDADTVRIVQAITNLLNNAAKYTQPGGEIHVGVRRDQGFARIVVRDNGIGIAPNLLPRIFDLFQRGDNRIEREAGGLGIGLTLARRLVEMHGGTIVAASNGLGLGSTFSIRLPLAQEPLADDRAASDRRPDSEQRV